MCKAMLTHRAMLMHKAILMRRAMLITAVAFIIDTIFSSGNLLCTQGPGPVSHLGDHRLLHACDVLCNFQMLLVAGLGWDDGA